MISLFLFSTERITVCSDGKVLDMHYLLFLLGMQRRISAASTCLQTWTEGEGSIIDAIEEHSSTQAVRESERGATRSKRYQGRILIASRNENGWTSITLETLINEFVKYRFTRVYLVQPKIASVGQRCSMLILSGVPDAITQCNIDTSTSNVTITISCHKSYAQGDNDGYACTLFKYNEKNSRKLFEEIARTKSCIFALENFYEPVEFRVAAFNRYGSLPINTNGYVIRLNQPAGLFEPLMTIISTCCFVAIRLF